MINFRNFDNNKNFCFKYSIKHYCTGKCKFSNNLYELKITHGFIDIPLEAYTNPKISNFDDLIKENIFMNINTICKEETCYSEDTKNLNFYVKKYDILEYPPILSINTNINDFNELLKYKDFINKIFINTIYINDVEYELVGFITQPFENHFVTYFKNFNNIYKDSLLRWYKYNDMDGIIKEIKADSFGISNVRPSEAIALLIYKKFNK